MMRHDRKPPMRAVVWRPPPWPARARAGRADTAPPLHLVDMPGAGPEDVAINVDGSVFSGLADGRILRTAPDGSHVEVVADTGGRPLGVEIDPDGVLRVCDARRGVLAVDPRTGAVREVVTTVAARPMLFCNNGALASDGTFYFTDSSRLYGVDHYRGELLAHTGTGRLLRRTPDGSVDLVAQGLQFANGVALAPDESWVAVAETGSFRIDRVWLVGARAGTREPFIATLPAFPDNLSTGSDGLIWVALPNPRDRVFDALATAPPLLRRAAWALPDPVVSALERPTVWVQAYNTDGRLVHDLQTHHPRFAMTTGVRERDGVVWLGSLTSPAMARLEL